MFGAAGGLWPPPPFRRFYGDVCAGFGEQERMTAIAMCFVQAGIVIAADGRSVWHKETEVGQIKERERQDQQKIFCCCYNRREIACALTGKVQDVHFDLVPLALTFLRDLSAAEHLAPVAFLEQFGLRVTQAYRKAVAEGKLSGLFDPNPIEMGLIARIFFVGYFTGPRPVSAWVDIVHKAEVLQPPAIQYGEVRPELTTVPFISGSNAVAHALFVAPHPDLKQYIVAITGGSSIEDARMCARKCIEAHSTLTARELDPDMYRLVGGHIHSAKVTPSGFTWLDEPKPPILSACNIL